jgi:AcrR family transcriptional regulator
LARRHPVPLTPRKLPMQARSAATVEAIRDATIQVLLRDGKERLTTTRVAARAGVSVGTLYQYFPNKSALLRAALKRHLDEVAEAVERVCLEQRGKSVGEMATALVGAYFETKMRDPKTSVALYSVSSDIDGAKIVRQVGMRCDSAIVAMLGTARVPLRNEVQIVSVMLQSSMAGVVRRMLESGATAEQIDAFREELILMTRAYLEACVQAQARRRRDRIEDSSPAVSAYVFS